jgi:amino acid adenylation domain-containing protein
VQQPNATAIIFEDQRLTYQKLDQRANQLAHYLQELGVGPEVLVGVCMERSPELVVALLGILKAGGAYLPLDPANPKARLAFMLEDAQVPVLLSQRSLVESLPQHSARVISLDTDWASIAQERAEKPTSGVTVDNLAYAIYTSGSTGRPKGGLIAHRGLISLSEAQIRAFGVGPGHRVLQFSSLSFDASIFETVMALGSGAALCLATRDVLLPGPGLIRLLRDLSITIVTLPPSVLAALPVEELPALETITVAGEACSADLVARWATNRRFFNLYGLTETTIWTTMAECTDGSRTPPIGRPIANTQVYLLDDHFLPVPVGVPGELYIGGVSVGRGYLNRPGLTAEKFIPNPFGDEPGTRLYRTGDLARYLPDGDIEFLGRIDHQVKIRGFRIELGEIEAVLSQHPVVKDAVVVASPTIGDGRGEPGDKRLVAYVVTNRDQQLTAGELRGFLKERVPDYMVPAVFMFLDELPLMPSGKVDRRALPAPEGVRPELEAAYVAPQTEIEQTIAKVWREALGVDKVGVYDNFFDLGGHSLLVVQVRDKLQKAFGCDLPIVEMFRYPTIDALVKYLRQEEDLSAENIREHAQKQAEAIRRQKQLMASLRKRLI